MKKKIIYIDMDDTICHFAKRFYEMTLKEPGIKWPHSQYGFFTNLDPIEGAIEGVNKLRETNDVYILTRPSTLNPLCYTEKRIWIEKHFDLDFCENLILCCHKGLLKGDILIDDKPWPTFEGEQILFGGQQFQNWKQVLDYLK